MTIRHFERFRQGFINIVFHYTWIELVVLFVSTFGLFVIFANFFLGPYHQTHTVLCSISFVNFEIVFRLTDTCNH